MREKTKQLKVDELVTTASIRLPLAVYIAVKEKASREGKSVNLFITEILDNVTKGKDDV